MLEIKAHQDNQKNLLEILREENHYLPALCAGRGTCGKCRVKIVKGEAAVTESDRSFFSREELSQGWRLSCKCVPKETLYVEMETETGFEVLGAFVSKEKPHKADLCEEKFSGTESCEAESHVGDTHKARYLLGIDIGTTTIAMALLDVANGQVVEEYLTLNRQRMYGADVISRIQASMEGRGTELQSLIREDLWKGILQVTKGGEMMPVQIVIAANTTMIHLLMGYPCAGLGQYPFAPYYIGEIKGTVLEILGEFKTVMGTVSETAAVSETVVSACENIPVHILPGISTFVGADIVSDMLCCCMAEDTKVSVLVDVGTNGEMAIGNREKILVTSTAAGPAFEGGNISCGTGSVPGAICGVELLQKEQGCAVCLQTIQDCPPVGICGTGTIELLYEMLENEIMDETGYMEEDELVLATSGEGRTLTFTQKDVRQLQLAKAAIRAGVETLLLRYGITAEAVDTVYLAGGFGYHINLDKAMGIGLLPEGFRGKIKLLGNGALQGALRYGAGILHSGEVSINSRKPDMDGMVSKIVDISEEIGLATDSDFNELYLENMGFY